MHPSSIQPVSRPASQPSIHPCIHADKQMINLCSRMPTCIHDAQLHTCINTCVHKCISA